MWKINQIERELGYPRNALHNYKCGSEPSATRLIELAKYFGITPEYLLRKVECNNYPSTTLFFEQLSVPQKIEMLEICQKWVSDQLKRYH